MDGLIEASELYWKAFEQDPPIPFGVSDEHMEEVIRDAVRAGEPIPDDYDWWSELPDGAVA